MKPVAYHGFATIATTSTGRKNVSRTSSESFPCSRRSRGPCQDVLHSKRKKPKPTGGNNQGGSITTVTTSEEVSPAPSDPEFAAAATRIVSWPVGRDRHRRRRQRRAPLLLLLHRAFLANAAGERARHLSRAERARRSWEIVRHRVQDEDSQGKGQALQSHGERKDYARVSVRQHLLSKTSQRRKGLLAGMIQVKRSDYNIVGGLPYLNVKRRAN